MRNTARLVSSVVLLLCFASIAGAKGKKHQDAGGISGKLVGVSPSMIFIQQKGEAVSGGPAAQIKIKVDANTTVEIDGVPGKKVTDLQAGERVVVQGGTDGPATDIQATTHKRNHKAK